MTEERKPMSIEELEVALMELPDEQMDDLLNRILSRRAAYEEDIDPEVLERARRTVADIRSGRETTVPAEQVLRDLEAAVVQMPEDNRAELVDRILHLAVGEVGYDPTWVAEMNRRLDEIESGQAKTLSEEEFFAGLTARRHARSLSR